MYLIVCECGLMYIGITRRSVREGTAELSQELGIKVKEAPLVEHFLETNHFKFDVFDKFQSQDYI